MARVHDRRTMLKTAALFGLAAVTCPSRLTAASFDKWWIKICTKHTEATTIHFACWEKDEGDKLVRFYWNNGDPAEFALPGKILDQNFGELYLFAEVEQKGKNAYFGLCHGATVCCKHYDFDQNERHTVKSGDSDEWKCN